MSSALIVTRDVEARYRGFLTSVMLELSPGVYLSPRMSAGVRERVWAVLSGWHQTLGRGALVLAWPDARCSGGLGLRSLGEPPKTIVDLDGMLILKSR